MKKILVLGVLALLLIFATTPVGADPTVGNVDMLFAGALLGNSGNEEAIWLNGLGFTVEKEYDGTDLKWFNVSGTIWAAELFDFPAYYFIKIGTGDTNIQYNHFLYQNNPEYKYLVIDLKDWYIGTTLPEPLPNNVNVDRVSHVGEGTSVPEPTTLLLLGLGLIGIAEVGRKLKK